MKEEQIKDLTDDELIELGNDPHMAKWLSLLLLSSERIRRLSKPASIENFALGDK